MKSLVRVAELFERKWKILDDEEDAFDMDTLLPHERNLRTAARQIEVKGMACVVQVLRTAKSEGKMLHMRQIRLQREKLGNFPCLESRLVKIFRPPFL